RVVRSRHWWVWVQVKSSRKVSSASTVASLGSTTKAPTGATSKAPMSQRGPCGRETPRWSMAAHALGEMSDVEVLPASIAGLTPVQLASGTPAAVHSAWVWVGPPLFCKTGTRRGSCPRILPVVVPPILQPLVLRMRLKPSELNVVALAEQSGAV